MGTAELATVAAPPPPSLTEDGEALSPEEMVMKLRGRIGELTIERLEISLPEPKHIIMAAFEREVTRLGGLARPVLDLARGRAKPVFGDPRGGGVEITPEWVAGLLIWFDRERMLKLIDEMAAAEIDDRAARSTRPHIRSSTSEPR